MRQSADGVDGASVRSHDLRHTFATLALSNGADRNTIIRMLGHASMNTTLDVYPNVMPGMRGRALAALDGVFS